LIDTFRPVPFASEMAISKSVAWLNEQLEMGNERLLLMDCRPQELYESSHIESAINVAIPGIMLRRLQKGNLPLRALVSSSEEDRERFARRCGTDTVVLYDEHSRDWNENTGGESVLGLLLKRLKDEGCKAFYLEGERGCLGGPGNGASPPRPRSARRDLADRSGRSRAGGMGPGGGREGQKESLPRHLSRGPRGVKPHRALIFDVLSPPLQQAIFLNLLLAGMKISLSSYLILISSVLGDQLPALCLTCPPLPLCFCADEARGKNCGVLVHCLAGISRSVTVTVAYLMQKLNLSMNDAYDIVKMKKSNISPNFNFMGQLLDFERTLGLSSPCDNRVPNQQLYFTAPSNQNVFQVDSLQST
ncbi:DUS6 phosphatase, partial [Ceuthmochares aereus]|nr:DUS6 phosphatase [Ceuthmochares aereus]